MDLLLLDEMELNPDFGLEPEVLKYKVFKCFISKILNWKCCNSLLSGEVKKESTKGSRKKNPTLMAWPLRLGGGV